MADAGGLGVSLGALICHCEERSDEAISGVGCRRKLRDCFATLAMTLRMGACG
jgi:hypothetical protein